MPRAGVRMTENLPRSWVERAFNVLQRGLPEGSTGDGRDAVLQIAEIWPI